MPDEMPGVPLAWDNVVYQGEGLGYVVSTHQDIRVSPPRRSVFSAYQALSTGDPDTTRRWLETASPEALREQAAIDLHLAYGRNLWAHATQPEVTLRGHATEINRQHGLHSCCRPDHPTRTPENPLQKKWRRPIVPTNWEGPDEGVAFCESPTTATALTIEVPFDASALPLAC